MCDAAEEEVAAGELGAVVTDARVERFDTVGEVAGVGGLTWIRISGDHGTASELGFCLLVLEALHLRAPCGQFRFHLRGDVGLVCLRGFGEVEEGDGGLGEEGLEEVGAGGRAVHVLDHHAGGFERPGFFDGQRERERAGELVVVG